MKRRLWLLMLFLFAGHVPAASADYRSVSMQRVRLQRHNRKWPGRRRTEPKVPCMVSAAVLPVPGTHSVSLALTGGAVTLSLVVLTAR